MRDQSQPVNEVDCGEGRAHYAGRVGKATGLRFSESLSGYLGEGSDFWEAYRDGRMRGRSARFWVTVRIPDLDGFVADPEHMASMTGRLTVADLGSATVDDGRIHLFCRRDGAKRLLYYLPFRRDGERYLLWGEKRLNNPNGLEAWRQMTTLYTELVSQGDGGPEATLGRGVLRIGPAQVARQALSFRPLGTVSPLRVISDYIRFLRFSSREIRG